MSKDPWYKRYPESFLNGCAELSLEETGAYSLILDALYDRDGYIPDDDKLCSRILRCDVRVWRRIKSRLLSLAKLRIENGKILNNRIVDELQKRLKKRSPQVDDTSPELTCVLTPEVGHDLFEKPNEIKDTTSYILETRKLEARKKEKDNLTVIQKDKKSSKGTRLPEGWKPSDKTLASAKNLIAKYGVDINLRWEFDKFTDYWLSKPGASAVKVDWERTFLNWIRRTVERVSPRESPKVAAVGGKQFLGPG